MKPHLRNLKTKWTLQDYPDSTAYEAGYLTSKNAGWRSVRPVIDAEKCTGCLQCYLHCPDGVIFKSGKVVAIDYDFCKGCGICGRICRLKAIKMEVESK
ncbi:MAG: 4Fe-4S binding protein [Candidatus Fibromonas sp.]|jgi:pyruvate ferredoxin oxidoreductase delta subunit/pyruvate ferredoxin oxidoreductase gamma subunit|nr:4Fe-4S binding protein [Candidatus Fibromonas sp.]